MSVYCLAVASVSDPSDGKGIDHHLLATGGEDGRLCLFDVRSSAAPLTVLYPGLPQQPPTMPSSQAAQSHLSATVVSSSYVSCVGLRWPWLCVGGSHGFVSVYHTPTLTLAAALPQPGVPQAVAFDNDRVRVGDGVSSCC
jgi:hypothetical protein